MEIHLNPVSCAGDCPKIGAPPSQEKVFEAIAPLFWDTDLTRDHLQDHPQWVLRRVLEYGDRKQVGLSRRYFGDDAVALASRHRSITPRVRRFWKVILGHEKSAA